MRSARRCAASGSTSGRPEDVHDVGVAAEAQLSSAVPAHADDRELDAVAPRRDRGDERRRWLSVTSESPSRAPRPCRRRGSPPGRAAAPRGGGWCGRPSPPHPRRRAARAPPRFSSSSAASERGRSSSSSSSQADRLRDPLEQYAHVARAREHRVRRERGIRGIAQHPQEPVRRAERVAEAAEGQQAVVGIGALREPRA